MQAASHIPSAAAEQPQMPAVMRHASGACLLSGYTIKRGIGAGGFGEVYYATSDAGKDVALKLTSSATWTSSCAACGNA